jgi:hypothetical protein
MITIPMSTPSPMSPAVTRKSELPPVSAGAADALAAADGLATATADRVGDVTAPTVGAADDGAAVDGSGERDGLALPAGDGVAAGGGLALGAVGGADGEVALEPSDAHARESLTPGADAHTERAGVTHELPSAAVRESDTRMKG